MADEKKEHQKILIQPNIVRKKPGSNGIYKKLKGNNVKQIRNMVQKVVNTAVKITHPKVTIEIIRGFVACKLEAKNIDLEMVFNHIVYIGKKWKWIEMKELVLISQAILGILVLLVIDCSTTNEVEWDFWKKRHVHRNGGEHHIMKHACDYITWFMNYGKTMGCAQPECPYESGILLNVCLYICI